MYLTTADSIEVVESFISVRRRLPSQSAAAATCLHDVTSLHHADMFTLRQYFCFINQQLSASASSPTDRTLDLCPLTYFSLRRLQ